MRTNLVIKYVDQFGALIDQPENVMQVEELLLSIPDPLTFEQVRALFYKKFHNPLLTTFLNQLSPDQHVRILKAYRSATKDYL